MYPKPNLRNTIWLTEYIKLWYILNLISYFKLRGYRWKEAVAWVRVGFFQNVTKIRINLKTLIFLFLIKVCQTSRNCGSDHCWPLNIRNSNHIRLTLLSEYRISFSGPKILLFSEQSRNSSSMDKTFYRFCDILTQ